MSPTPLPLHHSIYQFGKYKIKKNNQNKVQLKPQHKTIYRETMSTPNTLWSLQTQMHAFKLIVSFRDVELNSSKKKEKENNTKKSESGKRRYESWNKSNKHTHTVCMWFSKIKSSRKLGRLFMDFKIFIQFYHIL